MLIVLKKIFKLALKFLVLSLMDVEKKGGWREEERDRGRERKSGRERGREGEREGGRGRNEERGRNGERGRKGGIERRKERETNTCLNLNFCKKFLDRYHKFLRENNDYVG